AENNKIKQPTLEVLMRQNLPVTGRNLELPKDANILSTTSPQSHITYVNPDFIKISGFTEEELLGQPHNIVRHPDMPPAAFEHMWSTLKSGRSWMGLVKNRCKNGDHYWVSAYVTPIAKNGSMHHLCDLLWRLFQLASFVKQTLFGQTHRCAQCRGIDLMGYWKY
ncbi:PAS domain-containing protein, partial [Bacillus sp. HC-TM]